VAGKPHLFVLPDGRMSYEPPTPQGAVTPRPKRAQRVDPHAKERLEFYKRKAAVEGSNPALDSYIAQLDMRPGKVWEMVPPTPPSIGLGVGADEKQAVLDHLLDSAVYQQPYKVFGEPVDPVKTATGKYLQDQWEAYKRRSERADRAQQQLDNYLSAQNAAMRAQMDALPVASKQTYTVTTSKPVTQELIDRIEAAIERADTYGKV
jgi:hypothetical protein